MRELLQEIIDSARDIGYYEATCEGNKESYCQVKTEELLQKFLDKYEPKE